jgi:hypothetical protein
MMMGFTVSVVVRRCGLMTHGSPFCSGATRWQAGGYRPSQVIARGLELDLGQGGGARKKTLLESRWCCDRYGGQGLTPLAKVTSGPSALS